MISFHLNILYNFLLPSNSHGKGIMQEPEKPPKNPRKTQIQMDEELAMRLHEEEKDALERMQRDKAAQEKASNAALTAEFDDQARFLVETIAERKRFFAAQRVEQIRNKPPTKTQLRNKMITFLKSMGRFTYNQLKNKSLEEIQNLYERDQKWINDFVPMDSEMFKDSGNKDDDSKKQVESSKKRPRAEHDEESIKKQKLEDDVEKEELRACLDIVLRDDIAINVASLATKYQIVDWKTHILTENVMFIKSSELMEVLRFTRYLVKCLMIFTNKMWKMKYGRVYNLMLLVQVCAAAED
ncbi:hypothetical protein Tco_1471503 [Tanacetum coccineum]